MLNLFLRKLFEHFDNLNVRYLILRNYKSLPDFLDKGSDIDILIDKNSFENIDNILLKFQDLFFVYSIKRSYVKEYIIHYRHFFFIKLDFHIYEQWKGAIYLTNDEIINNRIKYKCFYIPSPLHEAIVTLFSSMLHGGFVKEKYEKSIKHQLHYSKDKLINYKKIYGKKNIEKLILYSENKLNKSELLKRRKSILLHLYLSNLYCDHFYFICRILKYFIIELKILIKPKGLFIGFVGVDGSGKSTIIDGIIKKFSNVVRKDRFIIYHLFPGSIRKDGYSVIPHSKRVYPTIVGFLKEMYIIIKYWSNYLKLKHTLSKSKIVIMDRLNSDILIDPKRFRLKKVFFKIIFRNCIYEPSLIFYCKGNPSIINNRKNELSTKEIKRQQLLLDKVASKKSSWIILSTDNEDPSSSINKAIDEIVTFLRERERL